MSYKLVLSPERILEITQLLPKVLEQTEEEKLSATKKSYFFSQIRSLFSSDEAYFDFEKKFISKDLSTVIEHLQGKFLDRKEEIDLISSDLSTLTILDREKNREKIISTFRNLLAPRTESKGKIIHLDVTSMYPSQIRQYKLQPSGIVSESDCLSCKHRESEETRPGVPICAFDATWTARANLRKPCEHKISGRNGEYPKGICGLKVETGQAGNSTSDIGCPYAIGTETECKLYSMGKLKDARGHEFFSRSAEGIVEAYTYDGEKFSKIPLESAYIARGLRNITSPIVASKEIVQTIQSWLEEAVPGAQIDFSGENPFTFENGKGETVEWNGFLEADVSQKNSTMAISLRN
ncbi:MAG TPA: hypothetical protein VJ044_08425, partial [Candidatus Hodarchaeales archaeon]|nr:hypothetical protein [Candidatus Hodarchaeales archaeon]